jgi:hypothetical protein
MAVAEARRGQGLVFAALLSEERIRKAFGLASARWQGWVYSPSVTVWVFLSQCLSPDHSCRDAVARLIAWLAACGRPACSADTTAYCAARDKLPEAACRQLALETGQSLEDEAPRAWLWHGRRTRVVDGTTVTMPDTPANQREYPQQPNQAPGCGFPIARLVVVFSLAVGAVVEFALAPYAGKQTGENSLFRKLHDALKPTDVLLADRGFSGWFDLALLLRRGVDVVVRKHSTRHTDFRAGRRLGTEDHLVRWPKPPRPEWMSRDEHAAMPSELTLRELRVHVNQPGFRTRSLLVITSLLCAEEFTAVEIARLYRRRWDAELCLRSLKTVMQMDHLRCRAPHRVRNEISMHLASYNLIRAVMAATARESDRLPWQVSFKGTMQTLNNLLPQLPHMQADDWCDLLFAALNRHVVGDRPDRVEPRARKRRPKHYPLLRAPRDQSRRQACKTR